VIIRDDDCAEFSRVHTTLDVVCEGKKGLAPLRDFKPATSRNRFRRLTFCPSLHREP